jgi:hypothetical protein
LGFDASTVTAGPAPNVALQPSDTHTLVWS